MKITRRILLLGKSVILGSIEARLRRLSHFEVTTMGPLPLEPQQIEDIKPDIVLFDLHAPQTEVVFSLLKADPALVLIGISSGINLVWVWRGYQMQDILTQDLIELITESEKPSV